MLVSPAIFRHVKCSHQLLFARTARCASTKILADGVSVTKKKYLDLPSGFASPDGVAIAPLPAFGGTIRLKAKTRRLVEQAVVSGSLGAGDLEEDIQDTSYDLKRRKEVAASPPEVDAATIAVDTGTSDITARKTRRKRVSRGTSAEVDGAEASASNDTSTPEPPARKTRRKRISQDVATEVDEAKAPATDAVHAPELSPRKTRRKRVTQDATPGADEPKASATEDTANTPEPSARRTRRKRRIPEVVAEADEVEASLAEDTNTSPPATRKTRRKRVSQEVNTEGDDAVISATEDASPPEPSVRKTRRKRSVPDAVVAESPPSLDDDTPAPKTRKTRKPRKAKEESPPRPVEEVGISAGSFEEPPKRRRRKSAADSVDESQPAKTSTRRGKKAIDATQDAHGIRLSRNFLAREIRENLVKFPHCILLTRVGTFYESYFEQAAEVASLLSIKLTSRVWDGNRVLMAGFPVQHLDKYLKVLVQQNKRFVAMCEEFRKPGVPQTNFERTFDRRVTRVLTPGTLIDESFLNHYENNYLLSIGRPADAEGQQLGLAWLDVSTGEFFAQQSNTDALRDEVARICPQEIVLDRRLEACPDDPIRRLLAEEGCFVSYADLDETTSTQGVTPATPAAAMDDLTATATSTDDPTTSAVGSSDAITTPSSTEHSQPVFSVDETAAIHLLTSFLHQNLMEHAPQLQVGSYSRAQRAGVERMQIDAHTIKALEIRETMREGGQTGTLLSVMKRTATNSGTRLLARWLCSPSTSIAEISARQSLVALFLRLEPLRRDVRELLRRIEDASRIVQRFLLRRGDTEDLAAIRDTILLWNRIRVRIDLERALDVQGGEEREHDWTGLNMLLGKLKGMQDLMKRIDATVYSKGAARGRSGGAEDEEGSDEEGESENDGESVATTIVAGSIRYTIKPGFSEELAELHKRLEGLHKARDALQARMQRRYDAPSLTLRFNPSWGFHVHIAKAKRDLAKIDSSNLFVPISQSGSTKAFFYQRWFQTGNAIAATIVAIQTAEREAFEQLRSEVISEAAALRRNARIIDEIDVTLSFATLAHEMNFVRPVLTDSQSFHVVNGRHPTVELGLQDAGRVFTPNTVQFTPTSRLHVITGPNMAGKSTLLRQTALIAILAQTGSYVPADTAQLGVVDKVFSRVGAKDDLFRDRSTFMVEMLETAEILKKATERSLVIMDEVGRGTTVQDGLAIAFATLQHLYAKNKCRALFATHFHEVADILGYVDPSTVDATITFSEKNIFEHVGFFCTDVSETEDNHVVYSHRLRPGVNRDSHGLKVASLAGMPGHAIGVASGALSWLKSHRGHWAGNRQELRDLGRRLCTVDRNPAG